MMEIIGQHLEKKKDGQSLVVDKLVQAFRQHTYATLCFDSLKAQMDLFGSTKVTDQNIAEYERLMKQADEAYKNFFDATQSLMQISGWEESSDEEEVLELSQTKRRLEEADVTGMGGADSGDDSTGFQVKMRKSGLSYQQDELFGDLILLQTVDCVELLSRVHTLKSMMQTSQKSTRAYTNQRLSSWNLFTLQETAQREMVGCFERLKQVEQTKTWRKKMSQFRLGLPHYPVPLLR